MYIPEIFPRSHIAFPSPRVEVPVSGIGHPDGLISPVVSTSIASTQDHNGHDGISFGSDLLTWAVNRVSTIFPHPTRSLSTSPTSSTTALIKRNGTQNLNTTIGVVVGILLTVFIVGVGGFFYVYHRSIRFRYRRRRNRRSQRAHHRGGGGHHRKPGSGSSSGGGSSAPPPEEPPGDEGEGEGGGEEPEADPGGGDEGGEA